MKARRYWVLLDRLRGVMFSPELTTPKLYAEKSQAEGARKRMTWVRKDYFKPVQVELREVSDAEQ